MDLLQGLAAFFSALPIAPGDRVVVAFSGGGDSTALLWGLRRLAPRLQIDLLAAHLDHGMDAASGARRGTALTLARQCGVTCRSERREVASHRLRGESLEAAARRLRYSFLEEVRRDSGSRYIATAHHRDDQAETVLLRLAFGTGVQGLAGIRPRTGHLVRPLLNLPRATLRAAVRDAGLTFAEDPGNDDPRQPRSRVRHWLLPALAGHETWHPDAAPQSSPPGARRVGGSGKEAASREIEDLQETLGRLATKARRANASLERRLAQLLEMKEPAAGAMALSTRGSDRLRALPASLQALALALLHRRAGAVYPASHAALGELRRQMRQAASRGAGIGCDCGDGWQWRMSNEGALTVRREAPAAQAAAVPSFTYTLKVPGVLRIPEIAVEITLRERPVESWMWRGAPHRAALALPAAASGTAEAQWTVRNRRPGDRLRPLGAAGSRKLKEILIDRGVPRWQRDRLPLLCWAGEIAWVPGVTIDERFRLTGHTSACVVEVAPIAELETAPIPTAIGNL